MGKKHAPGPIITAMLAQASVGMHLTLALQDMACELQKARSKTRPAKAWRRRHSGQKSTDAVEQVRRIRTACEAAGCKDETPSRFVTRMAFALNNANRRAHDMLGTKPSPGDTIFRTPELLGQIQTHFEALVKELRQAQAQLRLVDPGSTLTPTSEREIRFTAWETLRIGASPPDSVVEDARIALPTLLRRVARHTANLNGKLNEALEKRRADTTTRFMDDMTTFAKAHGWDPDMGMHLSKFITGYVDNMLRRLADYKKSEDLQRQRLNAIETVARGQGDGGVLRQMDPAWSAAYEAVRVLRGNYDEIVCAGSGPNSGADLSGRSEPMHWPGATLSVVRSVEVQSATVTPPVPVIPLDCDDDDSEDR